MSSRAVAVAVVSAKARDEFVEAKHVASNLDRPLLLEQCDGFRDLSVGRVGVVGRFIYAFYQAGPDAQPEMLLCMALHLAIEGSPEMWRCRLQPCPDRPCPGRERLDGKAHALERGMVFMRHRRGETQCLKWRTPVATIAAPAASTAATTSSSRTEPPGWMIALTPASSASCGPSAKGKYASEASTEPAS
jgi:hypothetical protein